MTTISTQPSAFVDRSALNLPAGNPAGRQAMKDLTQALKTEDLGAARQAFVQVLKNAPEGATWKPDSGLAEVGRALLAGDVVAAKEAGKAALQGLKPQQPPATPGEPEPPKAPSTTGGTAGTLLNVVA
jgi:hypothetical protein